MQRILTYVYYRWTTTEPMGTIGKSADRYLMDFHALMREHPEEVAYAGRMNCTCGGLDPLGEHYGFIIQADKKTTKEMLKMIHADTTESFDLDTMEKLTKELEGIEDKFWSMENQERRFEKTVKYLDDSLIRKINDGLLERA